MFPTKSSNASKKKCRLIISKLNLNHSILGNTMSIRMYQKEPEDTETLVVKIVDTYFQNTQLNDQLSRVLSDVTYLVLDDV